MSTLLVEPVVNRDAAMRVKDTLAEAGEGKLDERTLARFQDLIVFELGVVKRVIASWEEVAALPHALKSVWRQGRGQGFRDFYSSLNGILIDIETCAGQLEPLGYQFPKMKELRHAHERLRALAERIFEDEPLPPPIGVDTILRIRRAVTIAGAICIVWALTNATFFCLWPERCAIGFLLCIYGIGVVAADAIHLAARFAGTRFIRFLEIVRAYAADQEPVTPY